MNVRKERWLAPVFGVLCLSAVFLAVRHFSDEQAFLRLAREADPSWFVVALVLQALTYPVQGEIWRKIARVDGCVLSLWTVCKLALMKLFAEQALPSAGLSGMFVVARGLGQHSLRRATIYAAVVMSMTSFFLAYVAGLSGALAILSFSGRASTLVISSSVLFLLFSAVIAGGMVALSGRDVAQRLGRFGRLRFLQNALRAMRDADPELVRSKRLELDGALYQLGIFVLDGLTLWALLRSLGLNSSMSHAFASFMIANLVRTIGIVPAGLGTFEATAVLMLKMDGVSAAAALSATLLFRVASFLLPMAPGLWFSRHLVENRRSQE